MTSHDDRERGTWRRTPWLLRIIGFPGYRRPIFANWRIGGGVDGWEYTQQEPQP